MFLPISPTPPKKSTFTGRFLRLPFSFARTSPCPSAASFFGADLAGAFFFAPAFAPAAGAGTSAGADCAAACAGSLVPFPLARERRRGLSPASSIASGVRVSPVVFFFACCSRLYASMPFKIASSMALTFLSLGSFLPFFKQFTPSAPPVLLRITRRESR